VHIYCRAYPLKELRRFDGWSEAIDNGEDLSPESICYLWDDFTVVTSPVGDRSPIFDAVTPEWRNFCMTTLGFAIPADVQAMIKQQSEAVQKNV